MDMKKIIATLSTLTIVIAVIVIARLSSPVTQPVVATIQFSGFPIDQVRSVDFDASADELPAGWREERSLTKNGKISKRDLLDQYRDWLLISIISSLNLPSDDFDKVLCDKPIVRNDHLRRVASIESGKTRSALIGKGEVIALVPAGETSERIDHLGRIADEQRKNLGEIPPAVHIFEYEIIPDEQFARVTRRASFEGKALFTDNYGYKEQNVTSLADFRSFMSQIDDITYARKEGGTIILGGRKFLSRKYRGIRVEDVASVWKSENVGSSRHGGSGFSLDPQVDFEKLKFSFVIFSFLPKVQQTFGEDSLKEARRAIDARQEHAFNNALLKGCQAQGMLQSECKSLVRDIIWSGLIQAARYDGRLQGTEVGMVLFYTDLLMKLWGQDFANAAPRSIDGFPIRLDMFVPPIYQRELEDLSGSRLWLGSLDRGFQITDNKNSISFARNTTRVFAVPHDYLTNADHRTEVEPNYPTRIYIMWWNDHFEEVARYEPEYERLNEIMKWSQLIGWLNTTGDARLLGFLKEVPDEEPKWFPDWARKHPELTFRNWDSIRFLPLGYAGISTEALPILHSPQNRQMAFRGGVSLARREAIANRAPLSEKIPAAARRGSVDFSKSDPHAGRLVMLDKTEITFKPVRANVSEIISKTGPEIRLRGHFGEIRNTEFRTTIKRTPQCTLLRAQAAGGDAGELRISRSARGFNVAWQSRDIDLAQSLARRISVSSVPVKVLQADPAVEAVFSESGQSVYHVKLRGSGGWIKFAQGSSESKIVSKGFHGRIADADPNARPVDVAWVEDPALPANLPGDSFVRISPASGLAEAPSVELNARGPPKGASLTHIDVYAKRIPVQLDHQTGSKFIRYQDIPAELRGKPGQLARLGERNVGMEADTARIKQVIGKRDYTATAREAASDPKGFRSEYDAYLKEQLQLNNEYLAHHQFDLAVSHMNDMIANCGRQPDLLARKALAELCANKPEKAIASLAETPPTPMRNRNALLDELNRVIRVSSGKKATQENLRHLAEIVDWHDYHIKAKPAGDLGPVVKGKKITLEYRADELPRGKTTDLNTLLENKDTPVYIQDGAGINNNDWNPSIHSSLQGLVSEKRVAIYELDMVSLAHFKPEVVLEMKPQRTLRLANHEYFSIGTPHYVSLSQALQGQDDEEKRRRRSRAYIVVTTASD